MWGRDQYRLYLADIIDPGAVASPSTDVHEAKKDSHNGLIAVGQEGGSTPPRFQQVKR